MPADVMGAAKEELKSLRRQGVHDVNDRDSVWALIDFEAEARRRKEARTAKTEGQKQGISVALSDPCYELWTLLHLQDTGELFTNCDAVCQRLAQLWKETFGEVFPKKAQADCRKLLARRLTAVERAKQHHMNNDPSWTEVYKLIEEIEPACGRAE